MVCWSQCTFSPVSDFWSHHKITSQSVLSASKPPQIHMLTALSELAPSLYRAPYPTFGPADAAGRGARRRPPDGEISRRTGPDGGPTLAWTPLDRCRTGRRTADLVPDGAGRSRTAPDGAGPEPDAGRGPRSEPDQKPDQPDATPRTEPDGGRTGSKRVPDKLPARRTERRLGGHRHLCRELKRVPQVRRSSRDQAPWPDS